MALKTYLNGFLATLFVPPLFLVGSGALHQAKAAPMPDLMTATSDCLSACVGQQQPIVTAISQRESEKEKEPAPEPAEPYFLAFTGVGWSMTITIATTYLLGYLRRRPPDIFSLHSYYRI